MQSHKELDLFELPNPIRCSCSDLDTTCDMLLTKGRRWATITVLPHNGGYEIEHNALEANYPNTPKYETTTHNP